MIGSTIIYEFHEMCCPYHIACIHTDEQLTDEQLLEKLQQLTGRSLDNDNIERYVTIIDHNRLRGLTILGEEIDNNIILELRKFFPESVENMADDTAFGSFSYKFSEQKAAEFVWNNRCAGEISEFMAERNARKAQEYRDHRKELKEKEKND